MSLELLTSVGKRKHLVPDSLTHSAGTITAIFGTKVYQTILSGLVANTRYQLYLIPNGTMVFSVNENSVGPAGQTSWLLVGSFYANGLGSVAWGSFVNIEGVPMSGENPYTPLLQSSGGGNITLNATGVISPAGYWQRLGNQMKMYAALRNGTGGTATGAAGGVMLGLPVPWVGTSNRTSDGNFGTFVASGGAYKGGPGADTHDWYFVFNGTHLTPIVPLSGSVLSVSGLVAQYSLNVDATFGILGGNFSNTPIKDL